MKRPELLILAAGMGSRYGGLKQIDEIDDFGHVIIDYSIYDAVLAGFRDLTFVIKREIEDDFHAVMDSHLSGKGITVKYAYQELDKLPEGYIVPRGRVKPWGTAHAVMCAKEVIDAPFAVINADDFYGRGVFLKMFEFLESSKENGEKDLYAMIGYRLKNTVTDNGTVSRGVCSYDGDGMLTGITECGKIGVEQGSIYFVEGGERYPLAPDTLVSMNFWGFTPSFIGECERRFVTFLDNNLDKDPEKCEFLLPSVVGDLITEGKCDVKVIDSHDAWYGVTYKDDKPRVSRAIGELVDRGVYPSDF